MASPQVENGYTKIANELMEALARINISGAESQVFWVLLRKTYGFKKKEDSISLSQFCLATGMKKSNVCRSLSKLLTKNMIIKIDNDKSVKYRIQKDYANWIPLSKQITTKKSLSKQIKSVIQIDNKSLSKQIPSKENTKETISKEKESSCPKISEEEKPKKPKSYQRKFSDTDIKLTKLLISLILENNPKSKVSRLPKTVKLDWLNECRKLREIDNKDPEEITEVIKWSQEDSFEKTNVLSMPKLRKRYDQLYLKYKRDLEKKAPRKTGSELLREKMKERGSNDFT